MGWKIDTNLNIFWKRHTNPLEAHFGSILAPTWATLAPTWANLAPTWRILAPTWPNLLPIWAQLGSNLARKFAPRWGNMSPSWPNLGQLGPQIFDFWRILRVMLGPKIDKKSIFTGNTEKGDFLVLAYAKTLKLRFRGIKKPWKIDPKSVEKSIQIWTSFENAKATPLEAHVGSILVPTWATLAPTWANLAPTWRILAPTWPNLPPTWANLGAYLGSS